MAADCTDIQDFVVASLPICSNLLNLHYTCCMLQVTLLVHFIAKCLIVQLLRCHITLVIGLAGQLSGLEHLRWR